MQKMLHESKTIKFNLNPMNHLVSNVKSEAAMRADLSRFQPVIPLCDWPE
jgi:hypothetical protein